MDPDIRKCYHALCLCLTMVTVLIKRQSFAMPNSLGCETDDGLRSIPQNGIVQLQSTDRVTISVTLSPGYYDGINVYVFHGQVAVSSGSVNLGGQTLGQATTQTYTITLSNALTPGTQYHVNTRTRAGSVCSFVGNPVPVTVAASEGPAVITTQVPLPTTSSRYAPSPPCSVSVTPSSGDQTITVTWRSGGGILSRFYVRIYDSMGWSEELGVPYQAASDLYRHVFKSPRSWGYSILVKSQSGQLNSSFVPPYVVRLAVPMCL